ncbi:MAG: toll/interleukin-1 receptor domain-containing protein [Azoarcus sp.]|nr:toll/interleukin-1 receptor domain-containing protein [Azoarcus sp.]
MGAKKKDFFVSYDKADKHWAEWIAGTLEKPGGYSTIIQAWDFKPGESFVHNMDKALGNCERFIAVLSENYLQALYGQAEWEAAFTRDPNGESARFIPVRVADVEPKGLRASRLYIDLYNESDEQRAQCLLDGVSRADRPGNRPSLPGTPRERPPGERPFHNLPDRQNDHFTGRKDILEQIHQTFRKNHGFSLTQGITGPAGVGKTAVALQYAYCRARDYDHIWWVNAETDNTVLAAYREFVLEHKVVDENAEPRYIIEAVRNWMQRHERWLFIFDNAGVVLDAEKRVKLKDYLPRRRSKGQHILITSRDTHWKGTTRTLALDVFSPEEAGNS